MKTVSDTDDSGGDTSTNIDSNSPGDGTDSNTDSKSSDSSD